ncbi:hypothetical protein ACS0TY_016639 [Phlomoides rotata]
MVHQVGIELVPRDIDMLCKTASKRQDLLLIDKNSCNLLKHLWIKENLKIL